MRRNARPNKNTKENSEYAIVKPHDQTLVATKLKTIGILLSKCLMRNLLGATSTVSLKQL
jgi:hypothetical protein